MKVFCLIVVVRSSDEMMKRVCWFFLTVYMYLAMSVRVDLFPLMGSFCNLMWGPLAMSFLGIQVIDIYWVCCLELAKFPQCTQSIIDMPVFLTIWITRKHVPLRDFSPGLVGAQVTVKFHLPY